MISYDPLFNTLKQKGIGISALRDTVLSSSTIAKFNKNDYVELETLEKVCKYLQVPIEKVVHIDYEK